jgi:hypothetical protein
VAVPTDIAGLVGWWKADAITASDGDPLTQWDDSSGNANHLTGSSPTYQTAELNALPVVDGVDDRLSAAFTLAQPTTVFIVAQYHAARSANDTLFDGGPGLMNSMRAYRVVTGISLYAGGTLEDVALAMDVQTSYHYYTAIFNGASSSLKADEGTADTGSPGTASPSGFTLASHGNVGEFGPVNVAEAFIFDSSLSAGDQTSMRDYLAAKWFTAATTPSLFVVRSPARLV